MIFHAGIFNWLQQYLASNLASFQMWYLVDHPTQMIVNIQVKIQKTSTSTYVQVQKTKLIPASLFSGWSLRTRGRRPLSEIHLDEIFNPICKSYNRLKETQMQWQRKDETETRAPWKKLQKSFVTQKSWGSWNMWENNCSTWT